MDIQPLRLSGAFEITLQSRRDSRGYFMRVYDESIFAKTGLATNWVQDNEALSAKEGIIRGLHFQRPPYAETKFVRVVHGVILDVFVDIRGSSPTYGQWETVELSGENHKAVYIPKGFAHGYCTLTELSVVEYKVDAPYAPDFEGGLRWDDKDIGIPWPVEEPLVSEKDASWPHLHGFVTPFE